MTDTQRTLLLTGASRGIGHATVKSFARAGWRVLTVSRQAFSKECPWPGGEQNHIQLDRADPRQLPPAIAEIQRRLDGAGLHALVNNAGISPKSGDGSRLGVLTSDAALWTHVFQVNLFSIALLAQGLFAELKSAGGSIVNVTSIAGSRVHPFAGVAYAASKAGLVALTREMAHELGPHGVRVNAISPGEIDTAILSPGTENLVRDIPLRRLGRPEEVAETILFLCTASASYINGAELHINGGQHV
jgi:NAD(P)-dependent dehydrogenase (short-subunit alcohol dehydrogenase family)